jgi:hypothetical protein
MEQSPYTSIVDSDILDFAQEIAQGRKAANAKSARGSVSEDKAGADFDGLMAEIHHANYFGLPLDSIISRGADPGYDFAQWGKTVDVKGCAQDQYGGKPPAVLVAVYDDDAVRFNLHADLCVQWIRGRIGFRADGELCWRYARLAGWVTKAEWDQKAERIQIKEGRGKDWRLDAKHLNHPGDLRQFYDPEIAHYDAWFAVTRAVPIWGTVGDCITMGIRGKLDGQDCAILGFGDCKTDAMCDFFRAVRGCEFENAHGKFNTPWYI